MSESHGLGSAVVIKDDQPSPAQLFERFRQESRQTQMMLDREKRMENARQSALVKYVGQGFDPNNYASALNSQITDRRKYWTDFVNKNKGIPISDLASLMSDDMGKMSNYSNTIKQGLKNIADSSEQYKTTKGFDYKGLQSIAAKNFLYKTDPDTGAQTLKTPDELNNSLNKDYVDDAFQSHPELLYHGEEMPTASTKDQTPVAFNPRYSITDAKGGKVDRGLNSLYYPNFERVTKDTNGDYKIEKKGTQVTDADGNQVFQDQAKTKPLMMADPDAYSSYMENPVQRAAANKQFVQKMGKQFDPNNPGDQKAMRTLVYGALPDDAKKFAPFDIEKKDPAPKVTVNVSTTTGDTQPKNKSSFSSVLAGAIRGGDYDKQASYDKPSGMMDILPAIGGKGLKVLGRDKQGNVGTIKAHQILYSPGNRKAGFVVKGEDENGNPVSFPVSKPGLHDWMLKTGRLHSQGGNFTNSDDEVNSNFDDQGNLITPMGNAIGGKKVRTTVRTTR